MERRISRQFIDAVSTSIDMLTKTWMPSWASLLAAARPIPLVPPVISAVDGLVVIRNSLLTSTIEQGPLTASAVFRRRVDQHCTEPGLRRVARGAAVPGHRHGHRKV